MEVTVVKGPNRMPHGTETCMGPLGAVRILEEKGNNLTFTFTAAGFHFDWSVGEDTSQNASYCEVRVIGWVLSEGVHAMMRCVEKGEVLGGQKLFIHEKPTLTVLTFQHLIIMVMTQQLRIPYMRP